MRLSYARKLLKFKRQKHFSWTIEKRCASCRRYPIPIGRREYCSESCASKGKKATCHNWRMRKKREREPRPLDWQSNLNWTKQYV